MKKNDNRKTDRKVLEELRRINIRLREKMMPDREIAQISGVREVTLSRRLREYQKKGEESFSYGTRGRAYGSGRTLTPEQELMICDIMKKAAPDQLNFPYALRNRKAVQELILRYCRAGMPIRTAGEYLKRRGFTPQKPVKRAYEQDPEKAGKRPGEEYPQIVKMSHEEKAEIRWGDGTGICNESRYSRGYSPCGETPVLKQPAERFALNMISAVTSQGKVGFMLYETAVNAAVPIIFMGRPVQDAGCRVFLIPDNLKVRHSAPVKEWPETHQQQTEVFYLPPYPPEINAAEYLNCDLKGGIRTRPASHNTAELKKKVFSYMKMLRKIPERVKKYFQNPIISYASC